MKKNIFVFIIITILSLTISSLAEPFQFRNGISFGMTIEEIIPIEEQNGITLEKGTDRNYYKAKNCKVAGYDNCDIYYYFDDDDKLESVSYHWTSHFYKGSSDDANTFKKLLSSCERDYDSIFTSVVSSLEKKYEKTGYIENGKMKYLDFYGEFGPSDIFDRSSVMAWDTIHGWSQFLTSNDDNFIYIDAIYLSRQMGSIVGDAINADYSIRISYNSVSNELVEEKMDKQNRENNDL